MKYQVLARKYRPKTFTTMMGQEHVLKALSNALESERLHHAYLFTGTRGVGKTTVARVLAKALNCEQGISASPCGECATCQEIDQGRFIDLIEVDAASRTKVEDTRELLDNVQYAPTRGRFKIYLIDEVHMLSTHSFNALLKTLEEPPPHVKFLLATTDPQKLPVTILSRCLQFNLKSLTIEQIEQQLQLVLNAENIPYEDNVLKPLAIAADGSMRDALSLLDQSIAYSDGKPNLADIEVMLGSVQKGRIFELLTALANENGRTLIEQSRVLTAQGIDVNTILSELITTLQRVALCQMVPDAIDDSLGDRHAVSQMAQFICPEDIQLYYQIALNGRKDLPYSPQPQGGFEMILLRMLAFRPINGGNRQTIKTPESQNSDTTTVRSANNIVQTKNPANNVITEKKTAETPSQPAPEIKTAPVNVNQNAYELPPVDAYGQENFNESANAGAFDADAPVRGELATDNTFSNKSDYSKQANAVADLHPHPKQVAKPVAVEKKEPLAEKQKPLAEMQKPLEKPPESLAEVVPLFKNNNQENIPCEQAANELADYWHDLINRSALNGLEQQLAKHSCLANKTEQNGDYFFELLLDSVHRHLLNDKIKERLVNTLKVLFEGALRVGFKECHVKPENQLDTPRRREIHDAEILQAQAVESIYSDPKVQMIVTAFDAEIRKKSIKPV